MDDRHWIRVEDRIIFMLVNSQWMGSGSNHHPHPWDLDCIWEQLAAQEAGLA